MIRENKEEIYLKIINDLKRERNFVNSSQREQVLDSILDKLENVDIFYICSNKASNCIRFFGKNAVIIWDMNFWKCFEEYLMQAENCKRFGRNITQGIICVISEFLSKKYKNIPEVSSFLIQIPNEFGIKLRAIHEYSAKVHGISQISKLFSLFHELGHLEYRKKNSDKIKACQELVLDLIGALDESDFLPLGEWADLGWKSVCFIQEKNGEQMLEELTCDVFAAMNLIDYCKSNSNKSGFQLAYECVITVECISTFQNMFNAVNQAWDSHYIEMKFMLPVRKKDVNSYINELAMARNGLCSLILVIIIYNMLDLNECDREKLWKYRDKNHINNEAVISCLADDDFICEAIEDAFR